MQRDCHIYIFVTRNQQQMPLAYYNGEREPESIGLYIISCCLAPGDTGTLVK